MKPIILQWLIRALAIMLPGVQSVLAIQAHVVVVQSGTNFSYTVFNDESAGSQLLLDTFHLQANAPFEVVSSPSGWAFDTDNFTYIDWICTNEVMPYPQEIAPGKSLGGFVLRSRVASSELQTYALTSWDHAIDSSGSVVKARVTVPSVLRLDAALTDIFHSGTNTFHFALIGTPTFSYAVESSTNLINWTAVITNSSPFIFSGTNITNTSKRFFRAFFVRDSSSVSILGD